MMGETSRGLRPLSWGNTMKGSRVCFVKTYIYISINKIVMHKLKKERVLTSVRVDKEKFEDFKVECLRDKYTMTELLDTCLEMYLVDDRFKKLVLSLKNK